MFSRKKSQGNFRERGTPSTQAIPKYGGIITNAVHVHYMRLPVHIRYGSQARYQWHVPSIVSSRNIQKRKRSADAGGYSAASMPVNSDRSLKIRRHVRFLEREESSKCDHDSHSEDVEMQDVTWNGISVEEQNTFVRLDNVLEELIIAPATEKRTLPERRIAVPSLEAGAELGSLGQVFLSTRNPMRKKRTSFTVPGGAASVTGQPKISSCAGLFRPLLAQALSGTSINRKDINQLLAQAPKSASSSLMTSLGTRLSDIGRAVIKPEYPYKRVYVLTLKWLEDDLNVVEEERELCDVFYNGYGAEKVTRVIIPSQGPYSYLDSVLGQWRIDFGQNRDNLLIVYYAGHGIVDSAKRMRFAARDDGGSCLNWSSQQSGFEHCTSDVVVIADCCNAGAAITSWHGSNSYQEGGRTELLASCGFTDDSAGVGDKSFSRSLIDELKNHLKLGRKFTISRLYSAICSRLLKKTGAFDEAEIKQPVHYVLNGHDEPEILLKSFLWNETRKQKRERETFC